MTRYLLDTTVLVAHLRGDQSATSWLLGLLRDGHELATSCVTVAELERGVRPKERRAVAALVDRLLYLDTGREASVRAGRYQADYARRGHTLHLADALIAGTARAHGATLATHDTRDFPMRDVRVVTPPER